MNDNQYLPENAKLDTANIIQVNVVVGQGWRFYYANGETYVTESMNDHKVLAELIKDWNVEREFHMDVHTKPSTSNEPQTAVANAEETVWQYGREWTMAELADWDARMDAMLESPSRPEPDFYTCPLCGKHHKPESLGYRWVNKRYKHLTAGYYQPRLGDMELWQLPDGESAVCTDRGRCRDRKVSRAIKQHG